MKKICYYCIGILSLFSCQQETELAETSPSGGEQIQFVLAVDNDKNTRVTTDDSFKTFFNEGDAVGVFAVSHLPGNSTALQSQGNYIDNRKLTLKDVECIMEGTPVYFPKNGEVLDFYAYYPYSKNINPTAINYDASKSMYDLMLAKTVDLASSSGTVQLLFKHQLTLVDVKLTSGGGKNIEMKNVIPACTFNLAQIGTPDKMKLADEETSMGNIDFDEERKKNFRAYIPSQPLQELSFIIKAGNSEHEYSPANKQFEPGKAYSYQIASKLVDLPSLPNCYMVKPGGEITFPVLKAYEVWRQESYCGNPDLSGTLSVSLLWMDTEDLIPEQGVILSKDGQQADKSTITVRTSAGKQGNAVIAVKIGNDTRWVWHIWVTDYNPDEHTYAYDNNGDGVTDYYFMDRNLGALTDDANNPNSVGCFYQGGRNTPFPTSSVTFPGEGASVADIQLFGHNGNKPKIKVEAIWGDDQGQSIRRVLKDPLLFISAKGEPYSWVTTNPNASNDLAADFWPNSKTKEKTIYDPSPAGWMLPIYKNGKSPWENLPTTYTEYLASAGTAFGNYPLAGRLKFDGTFQWATKSAMIYCGESSSNLKTYMVMLAKDKNKIDNNYYSRANAMPVRCVKIAK